MIAFQNIFPTSQKIHFPDITKAKPVNAVKEITNYSENHMKHKCTLWQNVDILTFKNMVSIITTVI